MADRTHHERMLAHLRNAGEAHGRHLGAMKAAAKAHVEANPVMVESPAPESEV